VTTIAHMEPERAQILSLRKHRFDQWWLEGKILDNTYLRSLFIDGYLPDEANTELNLLRMKKAERQRR
jgi:hypothetical protein